MSKRTKQVEQHGRFYTNTKFKHDIEEVIHDNWKHNFILRRYINVLNPLEDSDDYKADIKLITDWLAQVYDADYTDTANSVCVYNTKKGIILSFEPHRKNLVAQFKLTFF